MGSLKEFIQIEAAGHGLLKWFSYNNNFTYTSLLAESAARFPKRISGAVHLIGVQHCKCNQHQSYLLYLD